MNFGSSVKNALDPADFAHEIFKISVANRATIWKFSGTQVKFYLRILVSRKRFPYHMMFVSFTSNATDVTSGTGAAYLITLQEHPSSLRFWVGFVLFNL